MSALSAQPMSKIEAIVATARLWPLSVEQCIALYGPFSQADEAVLRDGRVTGSLDLEYAKGLSRGARLERIQGIREAMGCRP